MYDSSNMVLTDGSSMTLYPKPNLKPNESFSPKLESFTTNMEKYVKSLTRSNLI